MPLRMTQYLESTSKPLAASATLAGIPYPDPTPAQQADWVFHGYVAMMIELLGLSIFLVSLIGFFSIGAHAAWRRQRRRGEVDSASEG